MVSECEDIIREKEVVVHLKIRMSLRWWCYVARKHIYFRHPGH